MPLSTTIRRYERLSFRFMDAYRKGLTSRQAVFAVKKYKSHRRLPDNVLQEVVEHEKPQKEQQKNVTVGSS